MGATPTGATIKAGVAQRLEQGLHKAKVAGSNPAIGIEAIKWARGVARFNTLPCHGRDRRFKSGRARSIKADII